MGSKASKPAQAATRKFPSRAPGSAPPPTSFSRPAEAPRNTATAQSSSGDRRRAAPKASLNKDDAIRRDAMDPNPITDAAFSQRLRQMGIATPNPTMSNSSTATHVAGPLLLLILPHNKRRQQLPEATAEHHPQRVGCAAAHPRVGGRPVAKSGGWQGVRGRGRAAADPHDAGPRVRRTRHREAPAAQERRGCEARTAWCDRALVIITQTRKKGAPTLDVAVYM
ncbi:hypothetical protein PG989_011313 [Apiospora arundinis]